MPLDLKPVNPKLDLKPVNGIDSQSQRVLNNIDPEIMYKGVTAEIFGRELGIDTDTAHTSYNSIVSATYKKPLRPSAVYKQMQEDGLIYNPQRVEEDTVTIANSAINRTDLPEELVHRTWKNQVVDRTVSVFSNLRKQEEELFTADTEFANSIRNKIDDPVNQYSMPEYDEQDIIDIDTYKGLLEQTTTQQQVKELRQERKSVIAGLYNRAMQSQMDAIETEGMENMTTGLKSQDVVLESAKGLYSALNTISRGAWSTSVAMGMTWNQGNVDISNEAMQSPYLTPIKAAGKLGYVARTVSQAIPSFAYNMTVGKQGIFVTEYGNAYQDVLDNGGTNSQADLVAIPVATINTLIESLQIDGVFKFAGKGGAAKDAFKKAIKDKAYSSFLKSGAKFTGQSVLTAVNEGVEGAIQQGVSIGVPAWVTGVYPKDENGNVNWVEIGSQIGQSFVGEGLGGLAIGTTVGVHNARNVHNYKQVVASQLMINEGITEDVAMPLATNMVNRIVEQDGTPAEIYREEISKVLMATKNHKMSAHIIAKAKGIPDIQYRQIANETTGKNSLTEMNYDEAERFIGALQKAEAQEVEKPAEQAVDTPEETTEDIISQLQAIQDADEIEPVIVAEPVVEPIVDTQISTKSVVDTQTAIEQPQSNVMTEQEFGVPEKPLDTAVPKYPQLERIAKESPDKLTQQDKDLLESKKQAQKKHTKYMKDYKVYVQKSNEYFAYKKSLEQDNTGIATPSAIDIQAIVEQPPVIEEVAPAAPTPTIIVSNPFDEKGEKRENLESIHKDKNSQKEHLKEIKKISQTLKRFVSVVPEFAENSEFTYINGMLEFKGNGTFRYYPDVFGLEKSELTEGQKVKFDLLSYGVKLPTPIKIAKERKLGLRGGFLDNTPFGNKKLLAKSIDEILTLVPKKAKSDIVPPVDKKKALKDLHKTQNIEVAKMATADLALGIDKAFGIMSTRVKNISPKIFQDIRNKVVNPTKIQVAERMREVHPFIDATFKFNVEDEFDFRVAQWQGDEDKIKEIVKKNGIEKEYQQYRDTLDIVYHEANTVGMDIDYQSSYFPSKVKDFKGLLKELSRQEEYSPIAKAMKDAQAKKQRPLSEDEKVQLVDTLLRGFRISGITLSKPSFAKERTLVRDDIKLMRFYYGFEESTSRYIESMTEAILERKFFGKTTKELVDLRASISRLQTGLAKLNNGSTKKKWDIKTQKFITLTPELIKSESDKAKLKIAELKSELAQKDDNILENSIGSYILDMVESGQMTYDQQEELQGIFEGLFKSTSSNKLIHTIRSMEYAGTLAQIPAVITQYSEIVLSLLKSPMSTMPAFVKANISKSDISLTDLGVAHIGQEWVDADFNSFMATLMKPFEFADKVGKETYVNSLVDKYRKMAIKNPDKVKIELAKYYPEEAFDSIITSLKSGEIDNNIKGFALNELADVQPISKFEVPELYSKAGNLRFFYMYKTFVLKRLDIMRNQAYNEIKAGIKSGDRKQVAKGIGKLIWLMIMFSLADSGADAIKDMIRGKPINTLPNYMVDNMLQMFMVSKYALGKTTREGVSGFVRDNIAVPVGSLDAALKDIMTLMNEESDKGSELVRRIPWAGELYYWYMGEGSRKINEGVYDKE